MDTQIAHISHTNKKGYVWRSVMKNARLKSSYAPVINQLHKKSGINNNSLYGIKITWRSFKAMLEMLKKFRDGLITSHELSA